MDSPIKENKWCENVIIADADYVDEVAFNLIVNFERMIGRRIGKADFARWTDCIALDGGVREGGNATQVVLIHGKEHKQMENFAPADYAEELDGKAFKDNLGEFCINAIASEELVTAEELFMQTLDVACAQPEVKRIMAVPRFDEHIYNNVLRKLRTISSGEKDVTFFTMQPDMTSKVKQEVLGYSLMNALGIKASEIPCSK